MAKPLTLRQVARNYQRQADSFAALAKEQDKQARALPRTANSISDLQAALAADDLALRSYYTADSMQTQADAFAALADAEGEAP